MVTASKISATSVARFFSSQIARGGEGFGLLASEHDAKGPAHLIARTRGGFLVGDRGAGELLGQRHGRGRGAASDARPALPHDRNPAGR